MTSLVLKMSVSLDGYVAPRDGSPGWIAAGSSDDALDWNVETVSKAGAHLMGAATYAIMAAHWPSDSGPFAQPMNEIPKVVFSEPVSTTVFSGGAVAHVFAAHP
jgi:dihydrofolate reductase